MQESDMKNSGSQTGGHLNQEDQDHMELLENILSIPSWSEIGVKNNWELAIDTSKLTKSELAGLLSEKQQQAKGTQENVGDPQIGDMVDDAYLFAQLQQQRTMLSADTGISQGTSLDMVNVQHQQEHLVGMNHGMLSGIPRPPDVGQQPLLSPSWRQPFIGGVPLGNPEIFNYGQREFRGEDLGREGAPGVMFNVYPHLPQPRAPVPPVNTNTQRPPAQVPSTQPQPVNPAAGGAPRPRVRARRGQATDPHSIAERLRRERIAERMKALQDLVPNANKTDKASMLDEIVDYVKFLQLQVKVLSMSRLGGAGAVPSLVADLPAEGANSLLASTLSRSTGISHDGLASAERQVARLMDEDMGSAMQYLQSKGLCLMPISLATASGKVPLSALQTIGSNDNKQYTEASVTVSTDRSSSVNVSNNNNKLKESPKDAKSPKTATKSSDESSRNRSQ